MSEPRPQPDLPAEPGLNEIESALQFLSPAPARLDRDRLMYLAGRNAPRNRPITRWVWPALAASFAIVSIGEAGLLAFRPDPEPRVVERLVYLPGPIPVPTPTPNGSPAEVPSTALVASTSEDPDEVVILHQSPPRPSLAPSVNPFWPPASSPAGLRLRILRDGLDALPEPPPLPIAMRPAGEATAPAARSFRSELEHLLLQGESS